jgi:hypothetical protein
MSQRPTASGPTTANSPQRSQDVLSSIRAATSQPSGYRTSAGDVIDEKARFAAAKRGDSSLESPTQARSQSGFSAGPEQTPTTRLSGVHSILNPSQSEPSDESSRLQSSVKFESPSSTVSSVPQYPLSSVPQSPATASLAAFPPSPGDGAGRILSRPPPRRILTPKSPGRRAASLHGTLPPPGTMNASEVPFVPARGRIYSPDPTGRGPGDVPPMPTPPTGRFPLPFPPVAPTPPLHDRRASGGGSQAYHSQSASPSPSQSSYSQYTSPATAYALPPHSGPSYSHPAPTGPYSGSSNLAAMAYGSQAEGQGSSYMTLDTDSGPMHLPVTVDLQAASKMADEKRKRNAGASARFRQRRKEKEKEASHTIAKLEQEIRNLMEERDFYRSERNYFRDMLSRTQTPIPPRPRSPIHHQTHTPVQIPAGPESADWQESEERSGQGRNTRRRTSTYQSGFDSPGPPTTLPPPIPAPYRAPPPPPPPMQPPYPEPRSAPSAAPVHVAPPAQHPPPQPPRTQSYDPFRRGPFNRSWNPGP